MTWYVDTDYPIAIDSLDHIYPIGSGTSVDYHKSGMFNRKLYELFPGKKISLLDLGCAGGGLTESLIEDGHDSVGLEGSDYSLKIKRAAWATIPDNLFTCDITKVFVVHHDHTAPYKFDVVTAWDVLEHIETQDLPLVFDNIRMHLKDDGYFMMTVPRVNKPTRGGIDRHRTKENREWWLETLANNGFEYLPWLEEHFKHRWYRRDGKNSLGFRNDPKWTYQ